MSRVVIYARYSSDKQTEQSIEGQLRACQNFIDKQGFEIVGTYIDRAVSARTDKRPEFQRMLADSGRGAFEAVVVYKLDRFSRNRYDSATHKARLRKNGVKVVSAMEQISEAPEGILVESLLEGIAEYYSAELSQKVKRGMLESALKGNSTGGIISFGYRTVDKKYVIDPTEALAVVAIFERYARGDTVKSILDYLNANGFKTALGNAFGASSLQKMLINKRYTGVYVHAQEEREGVIPQIIDAELFSKVQERVSLKGKRRNVHKSTTPCLLAFKLHCSLCDSHMIGDSGKSGSGKVYSYYVCANRKKPKGCSQIRLSRPALEEVVVQALLDHALTSEQIELIASAAFSAQDSADGKAAIKNLEGKLSSLKNASANLVRALEGGGEVTAIKSRISEITKEQNALERELKNLRALQVHFSKEQYVYLLERLREGDKSAPDYKASLIDALVHSVHVGAKDITILCNITGDVKGRKEIKLKDILSSSRFAVVAQSVDVPTVYMQGDWFWMQIAI